MGRIVVTEFISIDGVVEAPGGEDFRYPGWSFSVDRGTEGDQFKLAEAQAADALLMGRKTYESFAAAWPNREGLFAHKYNFMPKYVASTTLSDPSWQNTKVLTNDLPTEIGRLKQEYEGEISVSGSIQLVQWLLAADLVDEIHLMTIPVILGHGRKLWAETPDMTRWSLAAAQPVGDGVLITSYQRVV